MQTLTINLVVAPHSAPVPCEPLIIYMINTMSDERMDIESEDQDTNPNAFFQELSKSTKIDTIMQQTVLNENKPVPAWQLAIIKRNILLVKTFINVGLRMGKLQDGMNIFRSFVYSNDALMVKTMLQDPSIIQELNKKRFDGII